jgi:hypothetical protein
MQNHPRFGLVFLSAIILFLFAACATPNAPTPGAPKSAPAESEGLLICNFEKDISIWQGYSQGTETQIKPGETPSAGYINVAKWHAKYTDRWVKPTAGFTSSKEQVKEGQSSGKWENTVENDRLVAINIPHDWSAYKYLTFWAYSVTANKAAIELVAYSEPERAAEDNYYKLEILIDWTGWRKFEIPLKEFGINRSPVGWHKIDYVKIASSGWSHNPSPTTVLYFDAMKLSNERTESEVKIELSNKHPNLLLNAAEIAEIKQKIAKYDWAKTAFQNVSANAFTWSTRTIKLPETGGGYYHAGGEDYAITQTHYDLSNAARDLALLWQLTGERKYADKSKEILLAYARKYLQYEIHDKDGKTGDKASAGGRTTPQGINEAQWVIPIAWAYDLLYDTLSQTERDQIAKSILRPAAELLMSNNEGRHNHQTWYNAGIGVIGFALSEKEYVEHALYKKGSGFFYQMKSSVTPDGLWYEGTMHYQFFVLQALGPLAQAAQHAGIDVYQDPGYKALFDFPIAYADATLRLPVINDGREVYLGANDRGRYYEAAYQRWRDARYANVLRATDRTSLESLIYGIAELPPAQTAAWRSADFAKSGLAVLRTGKELSGKQVVLNYMGYEGGHSHPDQLGIVIAGLGRVLAPDAGSIKYEDPAHTGWYKQSLSHNLIVVNEKSQARAPMGKLEAFASGTTMQVARASTTKSYGSVNLARTLLLNDDYLVDLFQADALSESTFDWVYHNYGRFSTDLKLAPTTLGKSNGYDFLSNVTGVKTDDAWRADWLIASDQKVRLFMAGAPGTQVFAAEGMVAATVGDETSPEKVPLVIARRKAKSASFVSLIEPYSTAPAISAITPIAAIDALGFQITRAPSTSLRTNDTLLFSNTRGAKKIGDYTLDGGLAWLTHTGDALHALYLGAGTKLSSANWSVSIESLVTGGDAAQLGVLIERVAPNRWIVRNASTVAGVVTLENLIIGKLSGYRLGDQDNRLNPIQPIESDDNRIRFFVDPKTGYEIETASAANSTSLGANTPVAGNAKIPSHILDLTNWKITLPINAAGGTTGSPAEIGQPELKSYSLTPYFIVAPTGNAVLFRAPVNGPTTANSKYPRSELREMINNGTSSANWSALSGKHTMYVREAVTHLPDNKSVVMAGQIHDARTRLIAIRLSNHLLYVESADGKNIYTLDPAYVLGRIFSFKFVVENGQVKVYYNDSAEPVVTQRTDSPSNYFKAGAYTQSNCEQEPNCSSSNYAEVWIYDLQVTHQ